MDIEELGRKLREMYDSAPHGERTTMIHLFGITYAEKIGKRAGEIVASSGIGDSYNTEVRKGVRLSKYVEVRKSVPKR